MKKDKGYIRIYDKFYPIKDRYTKNNIEYIVYEDKNIKGNNDTEKILMKFRVLLKDRVMKDGFVRNNRTRLNMWNPLTWLLLLVTSIINFFLHGLCGVKEVLSDPFKEVFDMQYLFKRSDVEIIENSKKK